jgi:hypothetical protein
MPEPGEVSCYGQMHEEGQAAQVMAKKPAKSRVNEAGNYTKPAMRKQLFNKIKAGGKGKQHVAQPKKIAKKTARSRK